MNKIRETFPDRVFGMLCVFLSTVILLIVLYPLLYIVSCSFSDPQLIATGQVWLWPRGFNIEGYKGVFNDSDIMIGYQNTFFYTIVGTFLNLAVTLPAAYTLSKPDLPGRGFLMGFFMFTMYFSGGMIPTYLLVKACNLLDTRWVLLITGLISVYNMIVCRTFFQRLPVELEEAAMIDGSSALHTFIRIVLPLSKALMGVMVLYYGVAHWNSYFSAMIYISDTSKWPLQLFLRRILILSQTSEEMYDEQALISKEYMKTLIKYAVIIVSSAPVLIIYPFLQKYFDKGVLLGSVKG